MKRFVLVILILLAWVTSADAKMYRVGNFIVDDQFYPMEALPPEVKTMTPEQFKAFALAYNAKQKADAHQRHEEALGRGEYQGVQGFRTQQSSTSVTTHSSGAGGFLNHGDYGSSGSGGNYSTSLTRDLGGGNSLTGYYTPSGGGGSYSAPPSNSYTSNTYNGTEYQMFWKDLNDNGGGPITILNPYCWEYWTQR